MVQANCGFRSISLYILLQNTIHIFFDFQVDRLNTPGGCPHLKNPLFYVPDTFRNSGLPVAATQLPIPAPFLVHPGAPFFPAVLPVHFGVN